MHFLMKLHQTLRQQKPFCVFLEMNSSACPDLPKTKLMEGQGSVIRAPKKHAPENASAKRIPAVRTAFTSFSGGLVNALKFTGFASETAKQDARPNLGPI